MTTGQQQTPARQHEGATSQQPTSARHDDASRQQPAGPRHQQHSTTSQQTVSGL